MGHKVGKCEAIIRAQGGRQGGPLCFMALDGLTVLLDRAEDGVLVVRIMSDDDGADSNRDGTPRLRVHVNDCMVHREDGVCEEILPLEAATQGILLTVTRKGAAGFIFTWSHLPGQTFGPYPLTEAIRDLTFSALLDPLDARSVVMDAASNGSATWEIES